MYSKNNTKNKFLLFLVSFVLLISSLFAFCPSWLTNIYDTTLCLPDYSDLSQYTGYIYNSSFSYSYSTNYFYFFFKLFDGKDFPIDSYNVYIFYYNVNSDTSLDSDFSFYSVYCNPKSCTFYKGTDDNGGDYYFVKISFSGSSLGINCFTYLGIDDSNYLLCSQFQYYTSVCSSGGDNYQDGYNSGYSAGKTAGENNVKSDPNNYGLYSKDDYDSNYQDGYSAGETAGENNVKSDPNDYGLYTEKDYYDNFYDGYDQGTDIGIQRVQNDPNNYGLYSKDDYESNYQDGYNSGYNSGYSTGLDSSNKYNFFSLISAVVDVPVSTFASLFNFNLLGFNLFNFFTALLTLCVLIFVVKFIISKG